LSATASSIATWAVFGLVYLGLALGRLPLLHLDRAGIALVGATALLVLGLVDFDAAVRAIDFATIALLFGMMVVVAYLRLGGFFRALAAWLLARVRSPHGVLAAVIGLAGTLSAFLVNDVVCLALGPVVLTLARRMRRDPVPYLVALATAANIGSTATVTGNPQNMIIGALSHVSYAAFAARLAPPALAGLLIDYAVVALAFRRSLGREVAGPPNASQARDPAGEPRRELLPKGVAVLLGLVLLFFAGAPIALVALGAAALLMLGRVRPQDLYAQIDWNLLVMFAGLFVVVRGFEQHVVSSWDLRYVTAAQSSAVLARCVGRQSYRRRGSAPGRRARLLLGLLPRGRASHGPHPRGGTRLASLDAVGQKRAGRAILRRHGYAVCRCASFTGSCSSSASTRSSSRRPPPACSSWAASSVGSHVTFASCSGT
jgi:Na+/H+ antiporter NhaD/arsenite permease-like protein